MEVVRLSFDEMTKILDDFQIELLFHDWLSFNQDLLLTYSQGLPASSLAVSRVYFAPPIQFFSQLELASNGLPSAVRSGVSHH